jgi:hypothetical protein
MGLPAEIGPASWECRTRCTLRFPWAASVCFSRRLRDSAARFQPDRHIWHTHPFRQVCGKVQGIPGISRRAWGDSTTRPVRLRRARRAPCPVTDGPAHRRGLYRRPPPGISACGVWKFKLDPNTGRPSRPQRVGTSIECHALQRLFVATRLGGRCNCDSGLKRTAIRATRATSLVPSCQFPPIVEIS